MSGSPRKQTSGRRSSLSMTFLDPDRRALRSPRRHRPTTRPPRPQRPRSSTGRHSSRHPRGPTVLDLTPTGCHHASPHDCCPRRGGTFIPTFPSNTNSIPNNLGTPYPPITLRRNAGRTPGHRARHNPPRRAVRNPPCRGWRRAMRAPRRDTGHTTWHHPEPTPTSTNTPTTAHPKNARGKRPGMGGRGGARP